MKESGEVTLQQKKETIRLLFLDVDGTLTDGKIHIGNTGEMFKSFSVKDGYAIRHILPERNIVPVIITGRTSEITATRCGELEIQHLYQDIADKRPQMKKCLEQFGLTEENAAYIGDDLNDLECMQMVALSGCPKDAVSEIQNIADFISEKNGGCGAVRDFIDWLLQK